LSFFQELDTIIKLPNKKFNNLGRIEVNGFFLFIYFFVVLGFELRAFTMSQSSALFLPKVGFELRSSCSLPPEQLGLQCEPPHLA
jgi:hypothetical protein